MIFHIKYLAFSEKLPGMPRNSTRTKTKRKMRNRDAQITAVIKKKISIIHIFKEIDGKMKNFAKELE